MSWPAMETALIAMITAAVPVGVRVMTVDDVADIQDKSQFAPSVQILYKGFNVKKTATSNDQAKVSHLFDVAVCMRSAAQQGGNVTARTSALALAETVTRRLMGATLPGAQTDSVSLVGASAPVAAAGFVYAPVSFEVGAVFTSAN